MQSLPTRHRAWWIADGVDAEQLEKLLDNVELDAGGAAVVLPPTLPTLEAEAPRAAILM